MPALQVKSTQKAARDFKRKATESYVAASIFRELNTPVEYP